MNAKTTVLFEREKNGKGHRYYVEAGTTKGEVYDFLTEIRQEIFNSIQQDMANEAPKEPDAPQASAVPPEAPQPTDVQP